MVIGIIGESCTGKSTLANQLKDVFHAEVYSGKDYLRLAKNEEIAKTLFQKKLNEAKDEHVIYVISEMEHVDLLPKNAFRIVMKADLETIKKRFAQRMKGHLSVPVEKMLERKHGCFDDLDCHLSLNESYLIESVISLVQNHEI